VATPTFIRALKQGMRGEDVIFMRRCLWRAGHGSMAVPVPSYFGPLLSQHLKNFQKKRGLLADGIMGRVTFTALLRFADSRALFHLTNARKAVATVPVPAPTLSRAGLQLPQFFRSDHPTSGLPGYPAKDFFAAPETTVGAPENGVVTRFSGKSPSLGGRPGGAYGYAMFMRGDSGAMYFMTHLSSRSVFIGQRVKKGQVVGRVCDARVARMARSSSHVHMGKRG
jgi:hypothetical protein